MPEFKFENIPIKPTKEEKPAKETEKEKTKEKADAKLATAKSDLEKRYDEFVIELQKETSSLKDSLSASMPQFNESLKAKLKSI